MDWFLTAPLLTLEFLLAMKLDEATFNVKAKSLGVNSTLMIIGGCHEELIVTDDSSSLCSLLRSSGRSPSAGVTSENLPLDMVSGDKASLTPQVSSKRGVTWPTLVLPSSSAVAWLPGGCLRAQPQSKGGRRSSSLTSTPLQTKSSLACYLGRSCPRSKRTAPARRNCMAAKCCNIAGYYYNEKKTFSPSVQDLLSQRERFVPPRERKVCNWSPTTPHQRDRLSVSSLTQRTLGRPNQATKWNP